MANTPNSGSAVPPSNHYSAEVIHNILEGIPPLLGSPKDLLPDNSYTNITLTSGIPRVTDVHNPDITVTPASVSLYWPGGRPNTDTGFETILMNPASAQSEGDAMALAVEMRQLILRAKIGASALGRVDDRTRALQRQYNEATRGRPVRELSELCHALGVPLVLVMLSDVVSGAESKEPTGDRMAHMFYPRVLSPNLALTTMRSVVRQVIASEKI